jgi:tetratricopeptide (TPR) repeat protein
MSKNAFVPLLVILVVILFLTINKLCLADEVLLGQQAEQADNLRQALTHYVKALKADENNQQLREKIIKLAQKIQPPPKIPEDVVVYEGRAEAAFQYAKAKDDYLDAVKEYKNALQIAPWVSSYYFNIGLAFEKAGKTDEAIRNLKLYLIAEPNASDEREVRKKIAGLEYAKEKQTRIELSKPKEIAREGRFIAYDNGTVQDTLTGLMWPSKDNGHDINWQNAKRYCENYNGGGYNDWRMPTQDELAELYEAGIRYGNQFRKGHIINLTACCPWASEKRSKPATFGFDGGGRFWSDQPYPGTSRALPVRSTK